MNIKNQSGTLMIQALISIAIFGAITASVVRLMQMQNNLSVKTTEEFETVYFISEIRNILSNPKACKESFQNKKARNDRTTREISQHISDENGNVYTFPAFEKGQIFKETDNYSLKLKEILLLQHNNEVRIQAGTTGLHLSIEFLNKNNNRIKILERVIKLFVVVDANQKIVSCNTLRGIGLGKEIVGKSDDILRKSDNSGHFINKKKLLINTQKKVAQLNIGGAMRLVPNDIPCTKSAKNSLRYSAELNVFEICESNSQKWIDINTTAPFDEKLTKLKVSLPLKYSSTMKKFKICTIVKIDSINSTCNLTRLEDNRWQIQLDNPRSRYATCEAVCKN